MRNFQNSILCLVLVSFLATLAPAAWAGKNEEPTITGDVRYQGPATLTTITYDRKGNRFISGQCHGQEFSLSFSQDQSFRALSKESFLYFTLLLEVGFPQVLADCYDIIAGESLLLGINVVNSFAPHFDFNGNQIGLTVQAVWLELVSK